jgi:hypothetical protein
MRSEYAPYSTTKFNNKTALSNQLIVQEERTTLQANGMPFGESRPHEKPARKPTSG